jgi:hypothetical protein
MGFPPLAAGKTTGAVLVLCTMRKFKVVIGNTTTRTCC